ncbi:double-strand break repair helicase AddA [Paracoccaceae bacterium GXU_MW_L88]
MTRKMTDATRAQIRAAAPKRSSWVVANAGSGKTRVLTNRVARLLLGNVPPQKILCLTFTKAAAAEMQDRLFKSLGTWTMLEDEGLAAALNEIEEEPRSFSSEDLAAARRLFARALETPGGLKIQTIHSFCDAVLRRFPLEAGVSPLFTMMEDRAAEQLREQVAESLADTPEFRALAAHLNDLDATDLLKSINNHRDLLANKPDDAALAEALDADGRSEEAVVAPFLGDLGELATHLAAAFELHGNKTDQARVPLLRSLATNERAAYDFFEGYLLTGSGAKNPNASKADSFGNKPTREALGPAREDLNQLADALEEALPKRQAAAAYDRALTLWRFAHLFLKEYETAKAARGLLDFHDLIIRTRRLLERSDMAAWVLWKLDGGIDHILVDEAQDTSPHQWAIIGQLTEEFFAGSGARDETRTLFVVGDEKQSIYSFQGADADGFESWKKHFSRNLDAAGEELSAHDLLYSFRSSAVILEFVDAVSRGLMEKLDITHRAGREMPGRVDLWPYIPSDKDKDKGAFDRIEGAPAPSNPDAQLAEQMAQFIRAQIDAGLPLPGRETPFSAGDVMILFRSRSALFHATIRALKAEKVPVAGSDRLKLHDELAVKDLMALLRFIELPLDDLALAEVLRSPLCDVDEAALYRLAHGRAGTLWDALRREESGPTGAAAAMLTDMMNAAGFLRPYELLSRLLIRHDGRRRLIARLGLEAEDGIDALMEIARGFEQNAVPSLTSFLALMEGDDTDIKREMETDSPFVRVMTIHGAKGLEAPMVILPQTGTIKAPPERHRITDLGGLPVWGKKDGAPPPLRDAMAKRDKVQQEERARLLYVAMTRAESWLVIAGAGDLPEDPKNPLWYDEARKAMEALGAETAPHPGGGEDILTLQRDWIAPDAAADSPAAPTQTAPTTPRQFASLAPVPRIIRLNPSRHDPELAHSLPPGPGEATEGPGGRAHGAQVHQMLEWLGGGEDPLAAAPPPDNPVRREASAVIAAHPDLFATGLTETPFSVEISDRLQIEGIIDRLIETEDAVLAVDFKTHQTVPQRTAEVPEAILRQMGAYHLALSRIYRDKEVRIALLWTRTAALMTLPPEMLEAAAARFVAAADEKEARLLY